MNTQIIRPKTVGLLARLIKPFTDEGVIFVKEEQEILKNLRYLSQKGTLSPAITPKLIDMKAAAEMLGLGISNFKKLEKEGAFPFKRKMVGSSVKYRNTDIINYIMSND